MTDETILCNNYVVPPDARCLDLISKKIQSFGDLPDDVANQYTVKTALKYLGGFFYVGFRKFEAFVGESGQISVVAYKDTHSIELIVNTDETFSVEYQVSGSDMSCVLYISEEDTLKELTRIIEIVVLHTVSSNVGLIND